MENTKEIISNSGKFKVVVKQIFDGYEDVDSPQDTDYYNGLTFLLDKNNRYFYPLDCSKDLFEYKEILGDTLDDGVKGLEKEFGEGNVFPLFAYIHGGVCLSLGKFNDKWDSGCFGFVIIDPEKAKKCFVNFSDKYTKEDYAKEFVKEWSTYLNAPLYVIEAFKKSGDGEGHEFVSDFPYRGYSIDEEAVRCGNDCFGEGWKNL